MRKLLSAAVVVLWGLPSLAFGSAGPVAKPLAMADAVTIALEKNSELAALRAELNGSRQAAEVAGSLPNPVLELEGATGALTKSPDEKSFGVALSQEIPLTPIGSRRKAYARAEAELMLARLNEAERQLAEHVRQAWLEVSLAAHRYELARNQYKLAEALKGVAQLRFQTGELPELELQLAELERRRGELRQMEAQAALANARRRLATLLGMQDAGMLPPLGGLPALPAAIGADEALLAVALQHRSDYRTYRLEAQREAAGLALARSEAVPSLTVALSYKNERSSQNSYELTGGVLAPGKERTNDHILGLKLSMPLPIFSRNQAELARASARTSSAQSRLDGVRHTIGAEVRSLVTQYRQALATLEQHRTALGPIARENLLIHQEAFKLGEVGIQTVLDEKRRLAEQQENELGAEKAAHEAYSRLQSAVGASVEVQGGKQ